MTPPSSQRFGLLPPGGYCFLIFFFFICSCKTNSKKSEELLFWCSNNPREINFCTSVTNAWDSTHGDQAVHLQPVPEGQSSEEVILAAVVGKTTPDIYANMWQGNVEMYAHAGVLIPLDTLKGFLDFIQERCDSNVIKEITSSDGHIYQVPWKVNPFLTIYNKDIFTNNGITALPKTYSAYLQAAELLKENNAKNGITQHWFGYTEVKAIWYQRLFNFYPLYLAASDGAPLIANNKAAFNNKYAVEVFKFLQALYTNGYFSKEILSAAEDPFVSQKIATKWTGPWEISYLHSLPDRTFAFDYFEPIVPDDHQGPVCTYADPKNIVMFNTCSRPQAAWDFLKTLVDKEGDHRFLEVTGQLPRRKNLGSDPYYSNYFDKNPMMVTFARQLPYVKGVDNCEVIVEVLDIISQEYEACVVYGKKTPEKAIQDAETAVNVLLGKSSQ
ncbi:MAG: extracellular solute-binding protein [Chitinophagales bacterium]|nr:extracellular solute-binding protein [Chitinophagales bacterium]